MFLQSSGGPRCIARFMEVLFLGESLVFAAFAAALTRGKLSNRSILSRDNNNEAKGVVSWPSRLETEALLRTSSCYTFHNAYALLLHRGVFDSPFFFSSLEAESLRRERERKRRIYEVVTWLILPVVICLFQRLSHACLSINTFIL